MDETELQRVPLNNPQNGYNQPTLYIPIASPPTPAPSPGPTPPHNQSNYMSNLHTHPLITLTTSSTDPALRRHILFTLLHSLPPSDLLFVSQTIAPLLKRDFLSDLPAELALHVLSFVDEPRTLCRAMRVCWKWYAVVRDDGLWRRLCMAFCFGGAEDSFQNEKSRAKEQSMCPPLALSTSDSSTLSTLSTTSKPFSWRRYFKMSYIIRSNWRQGGTLLGSHRLPIIPSSHSPAHHHIPNASLTSSDATGTVTSLALDADYVVIGLANSNIKIYSARTGVLLRTLLGHESGVWGVCLVSKGGWLELESGKKKGKRRMSGNDGLSGSIGKEMSRALGFDEDGGGLSVAFESSDDDDDDISPLREGEVDIEEKEKKYNPGRPSHMSFSSVGWGQPNSIIVSGGCDKVLKVWDAKSGQCIYTLPGHTATIRSLRTLHNNPIAVTGSRDATLRVWDVQRGLCLKVLEGHTQSVRCLDICGRRVVSGSYDSTCRIWDIDTGECLHVLVGHFHQIYSVAFDGVRIASGGLDTTVRIWDASTGLCTALLQGHTALVCQVQLSTSSHILATGGSDGRVITFSLLTYAPLHRIAAHDSSVTALQFDDEFLVTGGNDGRVRLWDVKTGSYIREMCEGSESVWKVGFGGGGVDDPRMGQGGGGGGGGGREVLAIMCKRNGKTAVEIWSLRPRSAGAKAVKERHAITGNL